MDRPHSYAFKAVVAAITVGIPSSAAAAGRAEHVRTDPIANVDVEAALARVNAIRLGAEPDPQLLERALTVLGDSYLSANQYAKAEPAYAEALRLAERNGGPESSAPVAWKSVLDRVRARAGIAAAMALQLASAMARLSAPANSTQSR